MIRLLKIVIVLAMLTLSWAWFIGAENQDFILKKKPHNSDHSNVWVSGNLFKANLDKKGE